MILALAILGIGFFIFRLRGKKALPLPSPQVETFEAVTPEAEVLRSEDFRKLRAFGDYPLRPGKMGRENPFIPPAREETERQ